jgi:hypothetical protein
VPADSEQLCLTQVPVHTPSKLVDPLGPVGESLPQQIESTATTATRNLRNMTENYSIRSLCRS